MTLGACCGQRVPKSEVERLARQEQARRARLPSDGREIDAHWKKLRVSAHTEDGVVVGSLTLQEPKVRLFSYGRGSASAPRFPDAQAGLRKLAPIDVNDVDIYDGEVVVAELAQPTQPELWIHDLEVSLENIGTRPRLQEHEPILLTMRARVQRSATLVGFITIDPWGNGLDFAGRMSLTGLRSEELYGWLKAQVGVRAPEGVVDLYVAFESVGGKVHGGVKAIVRNLRLRSTGSSWSCFKAKAGNFFVSLFGRGPRNRLATVLPIEGQLVGPTVEVWPTVLGLLYDSFVQGIAAGFGGLPPPMARPRQGPAAQTSRVLVGGNRPLAQPRPDGGNGK